MAANGITPPQLLRSLSLALHLQVCGPWPKVHSHRKMKGKVLEQLSEKRGGLPSGGSAVLTLLSQLDFSSTELALLSQTGIFPGLHYCPR